MQVYQKSATSKMTNPCELLGNHGIFRELGKAFGRCLERRDTDSITYFLKVISNLVQISDEITYLLGVDLPYLDYLTQAVKAYLPLLLEQQVLGGELGAKSPRKANEVVVQTAVQIMVLMAQNA